MKGAHPNGPDSSAAPVGIDMDTLKRMMMDILQNDPQLSQSGHMGQGEVRHSSKEPAITWSEPASDSVLAAMSNTLAAFRGK